MRKNALNRALVMLFLGLSVASVYAMDIDIDSMTREEILALGYTLSEFHALDITDRDLLRAGLYEQDLVYLDRDVQVLPVLWYPLDDRNEYIPYAHGANVGTGYHCRPKGSDYGVDQGEETLEECPDTGNIFGPPCPGSRLLFCSFPPGGGGYGPQDPDDPDDDDDDDGPSTPDLEPVSISVGEQGFVELAEPGAFIPVTRIEVTVLLKGTLPSTVTEFGISFHLVSEGALAPNTGNRLQPSVSTTFKLLRSDFIHQVDGTARVKAIVHLPMVETQVDLTRENFVLVTIDGGNFGHNTGDTPVVTEFNELNNERISAPLSFEDVDGKPDFTLTNPGVLPASQEVTSGKVLTLKSKVKNLGGRYGTDMVKKSLKVKYVAERVSTDQDSVSQPIQLGSVSLQVSLGTNEVSQFFTRQVLVTDTDSKGRPFLPPGQYRVTAIVDPGNPNGLGGISEADEDNNELYIGRIRVGASSTPLLPDLQILGGGMFPGGGPATVTTVAADSEVQLNASLGNFGVAPILAGSNVKVSFLAQKFGDAPFVIATAPIFNGAVPVQASVPVVFSAITIVNAPHGFEPGIVYEISAVVDPQNAISEGSTGGEANNKLVIGKIKTPFPRPDFVPSFVPCTSSGTTLSIAALATATGPVSPTPKQIDAAHPHLAVCIKITNNGDAAGHYGYRIEAFNKTDLTLPFSALDEVTGVGFLTLGPGQSAADTKIFDLSDLGYRIGLGSYDVVFEVLSEPASGEPGESDGSNNKITRAAAFNVKAPDLFVTRVEASGGAAGTTLQLKVKNIGNLASVATHGTVGLTGTKIQLSPPLEIPHTNETQTISIPALNPGQETTVAANYPLLEIVPSGNPPSGNVHWKIDTAADGSSDGPNDEAFHVTASSPSDVFLFGENNNDMGVLPFFVFVDYGPDNAQTFAP